MFAETITHKHSYTPVVFLYKVFEGSREYFFYESGFLENGLLFKSALYKKKCFVESVLKGKCLLGKFFVRMFISVF